MMNADQTTFIGAGKDLASNALFLRGPDVVAFAEQFAALASRPLVARVAGDGETFRQALCFPIEGSTEDGIVQPVSGIAPNLLVEMFSGHVICLRLADCKTNRLSIRSFLRSIECSLERLPKGKSAWPGIQKSIEMLARRRVVLVDFVLHPDETYFWRECYAQGEARTETSLFRGLPSISQSRRKPAITALMEIQSVSYRAALSVFIQGLNQEIICAIRSSGLPTSVAQYNVYQRGEATAARYRIQAAEAVPLLGYMLGEENHRASRLRRLVDSGQPLWPALADTVGVPEETVRWLRGKTTDEVSDAWFGRIPELLKSLAQLPPEKRPKTCDEWTAYTDFALVLDRIFISQRATLWRRDLARLGWIAARQKFANLNAAPSDLLEVSDLIREITDAVGGELLPQIAGYRQNDHPQWQRLAEAVEAVFFESSLLKQIRASLRWHELQLLPRIMEDTIEEAATQDTPLRLDHWPTPISEPMRLGKLYAHFLATTAQLHDEGLRMEHCVGSYTSYCLFHGSSIVSLRKDDDRSVSTAELRLVDHGKNLGFEVVQHKAHRNASPGPLANQALERLIARFETDGMQARLQDMLGQLKQRQSLDENRRRWLSESACSPHRLRCLRAALRLHAGYDRFLAAGKQVIEA